MSSEYLFSLKLMLVLFDISFVHFCFILVNDDMVKPRPSPPSFKIKYINVFTREDSNLYFQLFFFYASLCRDKTKA